MSKKNIHVIHRKTGDWAVIAEGDRKASGLYKTQSEAIEKGNKLEVKVY